MSEQELVGSRWGDPISEKRQVELQGHVDSWESEIDHGERKGPFDQVMLNGAEVGWLAARALSLSENIPLADAVACLVDVTRGRLNFVNSDAVIRTAYWIPDLPLLNLEGAILRGAYLAGASLTLANLGAADMQGAHLKGAILRETHLEKANLSGANLDDVSASGIYLGRAILHSASMKRIDLSAWYKPSHLERAALINASMESARLDGAYCQGTYFNGAQLSLASLHGSYLNQANFMNANLKSANFSGAHLEGANMSGAYFDIGTVLTDVILGDEKQGYVSFVDARWGDVNLAVVDWTRTKCRVFRNQIEAIELGDTSKANSPTGWLNHPKSAEEWLTGYKDAVRANRQLATALRQQGLNEDADRFAYKAQKLQRQVLRRQQRYGAAFGSWLLDVIAGYGYKPMRTLAVYLLALISFAVAYFILGQVVGPHLSPLGAFVFSMTSFHGRGFFPGGIVLDDPITVLAAFEAFVGLVVEVSFIATFTQRFFAR